MKKIIVLVAFIQVWLVSCSQNSISNMPEYTGNDVNSYTTIVVAGKNYKVKVPKFSAGFTAIYDFAAWPNLSYFSNPTGYTINSKSKIVVSGPGSAPLKLAHSSMLDNKTFQINYKITASITASDSGAILGFVSSNVSPIPAGSVYFRMGVAGSDAGKIFEKINSAGTLYYLTGGQTMTVSTGDSLQLTATLKGADWTVTGKNWTTGAVSNFKSGGYYDCVQEHMGYPNTGIPQAIFSSGIYEIDRFVYGTSSPINSDLLVVGHSISLGLCSQDVNSRFTQRIGAINSSGGGDGTQSILDHSWEIINILRPKNVFINIGVNDLLNGVSAGTYQANLNTIYSTLRAAGIRVYFLTNIPCNGVDVTGMNTYIKSHFPYIDIYPALYSGTGTTMSALYNSGDGVHPNDLGQIKISETIISDSTYQNIVGGLAKAYYQMHPKFSADDNTAIPDQQRVRELIEQTRTGNLQFLGMSKAQRNAIVLPIAGMVIYQTDNTPGVRIYNGTAWIKFSETTD